MTQSLILFPQLTYGPTTWQELSRVANTHSGGNTRWSSYKVKFGVMIQCRSHFTTLHIHFAGIFWGRYDRGNREAE